MDRFGAPAGVALLLIIGLAAFASEETQNDFMRALLFGDHGWPIPALGIVVVLDLLFGYRLRRRWLDGDSEEMKRLAREKRRLQERLLGQKLPKTKDLAGSTVDPTDEPEETG